MDHNLHILEISSCAITIFSFI